MSESSEKCRENGEKQPNIFYRALGAFGRFLMRVVWWPTKIYYKEKFPQKGNVVCVCNHYSAIDANAIYSKLFDFKGRIVVKAEALKSRFVEKGMAALCRAVKIKRGETDIGAFKKIIRELKSGGKVLIFPEGKCNKGANFKYMLPFKDGTSAIAVKSGSVIVPTVYYRPLKPFAFRKNRLIVGDPIDVSGFEGKNVHEIKSEITELIRDKMKELRAQIDEIVERYGGSLKKYERAKAAAVGAK